MNYLTMPTTRAEMGGSDMTDCNLEEPRPGSLYKDSNIYSVPLFYNEFYETAEQTARDTRKSTQINNHHICNETETTAVPEVCGRSRYTSDLRNPHYVNSDVAMDASLRDSGTGSLDRPMDVTQGVHSTDIEVSPACENDIPFRNKETKRKCSNYFSVLLVGLVGGITLCSVVWLTIDKIKSDNVNCVFQTFQSSRDERENVTTEIPEINRLPVNNSQPTVSFDNQLTTNHLGGDDGPFLPTSRSHITITPTASTSDAKSNMHGMTASSTSKYQSTNVLINITKLPSSSLEVTFPSVSSSTTKPTVQSSTKGEMILTEEKVAQNNTTPNEDTTPIKSLLTTEVVSSTSSTPDTNNLLHGKSTTSSDVTSDKNEPVFAGLSITTEAPESVEGGYVYVRWGRHDCPIDNDLLYSGFIAGGHFIHSGGATNNLCLPSNPTWGNFDDRLESDRNLLHVTEYQSSNAAFNTIIGKSLLDHNVPCAVCQARGRFSYLMIPGRVQCLYGWHQEYTGYLMGGSFEHLHGKSLICVDKDPQTVPGGSANEDGNLLYFVEFRGTRTENYVNGRELACAVCTR